MPTSDTEPSTSSVMSSYSHTGKANRAMEGSKRKQTKNLKVHIKSLGGSTKHQEVLSLLMTELRSSFLKF